MDLRIPTYILILFFGLMFKIWSQKNRQINARKYYIIVMCIILVLQSGLRGLSVGPDTPGYLNWFNELKDISWQQIFNNFIEAYIYNKDKDPGFPLLVKIIQLTGMNFQTFLMVIAIFYFGALGVFLFKNTENLKDIILAFVLYVALFQIIGLSGIRQQVTTGIAFLSLKFIKDSDFWKFSLLILLGSTIHISLMLMFLLYFLAQISSLKIRYMYYLPIVIFYILIELARSIAAFLASLTRNDYYMEYLYTDQGGGFVYVTTAFFVAVFGFINIKKTIQHNNNYKIYYSAILLMTFFVPLILVDGTLIRIGQYFSLYMMVFVPMVINNLRLDYGSKNMIFAFTISFLILLSFRSSFSYMFFWQ